MSGRALGTRWTCFVAINILRGILSGEKTCIRDTTLSSQNSAGVRREINIDGFESAHRYARWSKFNFRVSEIRSSEKTRANQPCWTAGLSSSHWLRSDANLHNREYN